MNCRLKRLKSETSLGSIDTSRIKALPACSLGSAMVWATSPLSITLRWDNWLSSEGE